MEAISALAAINNAINISNVLMKIDRSYDLAEMKIKIAALMTSLAEVKIQHAEMVLKIHELENENKRLLSADTDISALISANGYQFKPDENGHATGWPACPSCIANDKAVSIMVQKGNRDGAECPRCAKALDPVPSFVLPGYTREQQRLDRRRALILEAAPLAQKNHWME